MTSDVKKYRVFIASPRGVERERDTFFKYLDYYTKSHAAPYDVAFEPVGWTKTPVGPAAPHVQDRINEDLRKSDYAVFVLNDWWGSPTPEWSSGTKAEWVEAECLFDRGIIFEIVLYFKHLDESRRHDAGPQLTQVLDFRKQLVSEGRHLFKDYLDEAEFREDIEANVVRWLRLHQVAKQASKRLQEAREFHRDEHLELEIRCYDGVISDIDEVPHQTFPLRQLVAEALMKKGVSLRESARGDEAVAAFDELVRRCGRAAQTPLRDIAAAGLLNKAFTLGECLRIEEEIAVYDEFVYRFAVEEELSLREKTAQALLNKGVQLVKNGHLLSKSQFRDTVALAIETYEAITAGYSHMHEPTLGRIVAQALFYKADAHRQADEFPEEIASYDNLVTLFRSRTDNVLRNRVAEALFMKCESLREQGDIPGAIETYGEVVAIFENLKGIEYRGHVGKALLGKAATLDDCGRRDEACEICEQVLCIFGGAEEAILTNFREQARSLRDSIRSRSSVQSPAE